MKMKKETLKGIVAECIGVVIGVVIMEGVKAKKKK